ncbi:hypothetical protein ACVL92_003642 [Bradyrhizobium liaoningense]
MSNPRASLAHPVHLNEVGSSYRYQFIDGIEVIPNTESHAA